MTDDRIKVKVASHGAKRGSPNLMMYYVDPITEKRVSRSTGTTNRTQANRAAAVWEDDRQSHQEGRKRDSGYPRAVLGPRENR